MDENQAKTKVCHKKLNTTKFGPIRNKCIGSDCMAWLWYPGQDTAPELLTKRMEDGTLEGYCGLVGSIQHI